MTSIAWTERTWNPMVGCTPVVSRNADGNRIPGGCDECYAKDQINRFAKVYDKPETIRLGTQGRGLTFVPKDSDGRSLGKGAQWTGAMWLLPQALDVPLRRRKPTLYFVNSVSDVFHESVVGCEEGRRFIAAMFGVMAACPQHTFQLLTKRPEQARRWFDWLARQRPPKRPVTDPVIDAPDEAIVLGWERVIGSFGDVVALHRRSEFPIVAEVSVEHGACCSMQDMDPAPVWPLPNVWVGTSVSSQTDADRRIPVLLDVPAAVRFISAEPLLGPIEFGPDALGGYPESDEWARSGPNHPRLDWCIVGGESGPKARPCEVSWIRDIVRQCDDAGVACFVKQVGANSDITVVDSKGEDPSEWPADIRVRQWPKVAR